MKKTLAALLLATTVLLTSVPASAKARIIAVFALRSTAEDAPAALAITKAILSRIGSLDGYDAVLPSVPSGANSGATAATLGAESYIVGQITAAEGDTFAIVATEELDIEGMVIVEKGAKGQGTIAMVEGAGSNGHAGKLGLQYDYVTASDGNKIKLSNTQHTDQGEGQAGKASTATVATYLLLGPLGLFAHNFVRGKDLTIDEKTKLTAFVDTTVHVIGARKAQAGAGYAK